ncbi:MFS transporter [Vallitalea guaymasensis]|uniref:MFS transporter n=2 Tax=Vallitalea guaymasensis TaxID=1185412 RepID=A0A8J8SEF9_9FIRM|nr:MFS transporter [Vallitalea guaymasensis]
MKKEMVIYFIILALTALGLGLSNDIFSNYFKDAYNITAYQRGIIEFPRELPGMLCIFVVTALSFMGDIRLSIIAQILSFIGIAVLGFITPTFSVMLIFLFINSMGMHLFFPLQDSIGISLIDDEKIGKRMGQYKGVFTAFSMVAAIMVFLGFRTNVFSFTTKIKYIFVIDAVIFLVIIVLFVYLLKLLKRPLVKKKKLKFVFRREYKYYYILAIMHGVQKQIMVVYGPWVLIDILNKKADTLAILMMIGSFIGIFFIPAVGRWLDRFGVKKLLYADALSFIGVYVAYGLITTGFDTGKLPLVGLPVILAYSLIIIDKMSMQMGMVKTVYLRSIAVDMSDITPTLSMGISMDHVVSILCAYIGGIIWSAWGPQYIFFFAATLSLVNLFVAKKVQIK